MTLHFPAGPVFLFALHNLAATSRTFRLDLGGAPQVVRVAAGAHVRLRT
ncbi:hypothetical protein [Paractinoplanes durhamensis]|nr:hypothetical protein [Actinoplanes durhamensis]